MLADETDYVIGVDTHRDEHALAVVAAATGGVGAVRRIRADRAGYQAALGFGRAKAPARRVWAVEGTGSYGAGLRAYLERQGERVVEISRPGPKRRGSGKSDELDAIAAARAALSQERSALPRSDSLSRALRPLVATRESAVVARTASLNELRALIVVAPEELRGRLRGLTRGRLVRVCSGLRGHPSWPVDAHSLVCSLRILAQRITRLEQEADALEAEITRLVKRHAPQLLSLSGVGPISAATILISHAQPGRIHSQAAFAKLAGAAPIPASSGLTIRHRLNRGGDRKLNRALHTIILSRLKHDPPTRAYLQRRIQQGKTRREAIRILKRYLARSLYRQLQAQLPVT
jgi:transposase